MKLFMDFPEASIREVSINLGGSDRGVTEHLLDGADVGAIDEEFGGEGVSQNMWSDALNNSCLTGVFANEIFDGDGREAVFFGKGDVGERSMFSPAVTQENWLEVVGALREI